MYESESIFSLLFIVFTAVGEWIDLVLKCQQRSDERDEMDTDDEYLPTRPVRRLGSEFLGKRTINAEQPCMEHALANDVDEEWICNCIRHWNQSPSYELDGEQLKLEMKKRGLGAILLSGKRMNKDNKWNNNLNRRVMGSEFLGKRAVMGSEFLGKRALGSEFLGKRALGSEFLGKRALGSEFLGKRAMMGSEFLGKRSNNAQEVDRSD